MLVELKSHSSLVGLLSHDNIDISNSILTLLTELLEGSDDPVEMQYVQALAAELADAGAVSATIANWERLRSEGEDEGPVVYQTMQFLERMVEYDEETAETLMKHPKFLSLCAATLAPKSVEYGDVELSVSEILSAVVINGKSLEDEQKEQKDEGSLETDKSLIESLLIVLHKKGRLNKTSLVDLEVLSNVANAVANLVLSKRFHKAFLACEGVHLLVKLLESKGCGVMSAMRVLSFATQDKREACEVLVEAGGIKQLFKWWMKDEWPSKMSKRFSWGQDEWKSMREYVVSTVFNCCSLLGFGTMAQLRLWKKFDDDGGKAVAQALAMWCGYRDALSSKGLMVSLREDQGDGDEEEEDFLFLKRLDEGIMPLMQLSVVFVCLASVPSPLQNSLSQHLRTHALAKNVKLDDVAALVREHQKRSGQSIDEGVVSELRKIFS